jgi:hypothetical protein
MTGGFPNFTHIFVMPNVVLEPRPTSEARRVLQAVRLQASARSAG